MLRLHHFLGISRWNILFYTLSEILGLSLTSICFEIGFLFPFVKNADFMVVTSILIGQDDYLSSNTIPVVHSRLNDVGFPLVRLCLNSLGL